MFYLVAYYISVILHYIAVVLLFQLDEGFVHIIHMINKLSIIKIVINSCGIFQYAITFSEHHSMLGTQRCDID